MVHTVGLISMLLILMGTVITGRKQQSKETAEEVAEPPVAVYLDDLAEQHF